MTVYDVIRILSQMPSDTPVEIFDADTWHREGIIEDSTMPLTQIITTDNKVILNSAWCGVEFEEE